ncbi:MAG: hypothetical protein ACR2NW_09240 [Thermodesulfobacteriota bacterium]
MMKKCKINNCDVKHKAKNYCSKHYDMFRRHGDPFHKRVKRLINTCSIDNCNERCVGNGYCKLHYERFKIHGDPLYKRSVRICIVEGCKKRHHAKGYCRKCYFKLPIVKTNYKKVRDKWNEKNKDSIKEWQCEYYKKNTLKFLEYTKKYAEKFGKDLGINSYQVIYMLRTWAGAVKTRDNYTCKICSNNENLNAHHILYKNKYPEFFLYISNGVTLCVDCHYDYHKLNGWK